MRNFVLDPAHGGTAPSGKSTPGLAEKALTLDVAERTREALSGYGAVYLTRERDVNPTIAARAALSRMREAEAFVSIHVAVPGSSAYGGGTWVHSGAGRESEELATRLSQALARTGGEVGQPVRRAELAVLDPASLSPRTAACLLELAPTATSGGRLEDDAYRSRVAEAIASAMAQTSGYGRRGEAAGLPARGANASASFDVRHEVQLVPQQTSMSCWAAAASMVVGWRDRVSIDPSDVARGAGHWAAYAAGLNPVDVPALARAWNLTMEQPQGYTIEALRQLLAEAGPLWIGEAVPSLHAIALSGMWGDGTPGGTTVRIHDPWPVGRGATYEQPFQAFLAGYEAAAQFPHVQIQVLHSGRGATARAASFGRGRSAPAAYGGTLSGHGTHERYRSHHGAYGSAAVAEARGAASMPNLNFGPIEGGRPIGAPSTPSAVTVGTPVQIMWADFNDSDVAAGPYEDTVTVRDRDNREVYRTQVQAEAGLDPQRNEVRYVVFTPAQPGTYIGRVQLNSGPHPIPESQIDDNVAETLPFTVAPGKAVEVPATSRAAAAEPQAMFVFSQVGLLVSPDDTDNPDKHVILHHDAGNMVSFAIKNMGDGPGVCEVGLEVDGRYVKSWRSSRLQPGQSESPPYVRGLGRFPEGRHEFLAYLNPGAGVSDHISNLVDIA